MAEKKETKKENKKYSFTDTERVILQNLDSHISLKEAEVTLAKNMYNGLIEGALKRCGLVPEKLMEDNKKMDIDVYAGIFEIKDAEEVQNKPPSKDSIILP